MENIVFQHENKQVIKEGKIFFTRVFENGESFESTDFYTLEGAKKHLGIEPTTEENNKLIAEFMECFPLEKDIYSHTNEKGEKINQSYYRYNKEWNWLIPVMSKLTSLDEFSNYPNVSTFWDVYCQLDITTVFEEVVSCIKWYNQQK